MGFLEGKRTPGGHPKKKNKDCSNWYFVATHIGDAGIFATA